MISQNDVNLYQIQPKILPTRCFLEVIAIGSKRQVNHGYGKSNNPSCISAANKG